MKNPIRWQSNTDDGVKYFWCWDDDDGSEVRIECDADGWIKSTDALPDAEPRGSNGFVVCVEEDGKLVVDIDTRLDGGWSLFDTVSLSDGKKVEPSPVIAWQPKPQPVKG